MALQSSGSITLAQIASEFGDSQPHSLSEFYRNGGKVPANNTNVPTSGTIDFADFYGATNADVKTLSSGTDVNLSSTFGSNWAPSIPKIVIIASGTEIGTASYYALNVPSGMGGTLDIQNSGTISGSGGAGSPSGTGGDGGTALYIGSNNVTVTNSGTIRGGGGGGGKGGNGSPGTTTPMSPTLTCVGGNGGTGGAGGNGQGYNQSQSNGSSGSTGSGYQNYGGNGGNGGTFGNAGGNGGNGNFGSTALGSQGTGGTGGAAGAAITGTSRTLNNSGTINGAT